MKKLYKVPEFEIIKFDNTTDVIRTSGEVPAIEQLFDGETGADAGSVTFSELMNYN